MIDYFPPLPFIPFLFLLVGLVLLIQGGNKTVDSAIFIAREKGIPPLLVGFTIVALGTSFPELIVSVLANAEGVGGIALGNVIGSNIANILLILGVTGILYPFALKADFKNMSGDIAVLIFSSLLLAGVMMYGTISYVAGVPMILFLVGYIYFQYRRALKGKPTPLADVDEMPEFPSMPKALVTLVFGLALVGFGARILIDGASAAATMIGVPDSIIALSIIAFGTSVPELSTSLIAARKNHGDMALGNVFGSNVFNILLIVGLTAILKPIEQESYAPQLVTFDIPVMLCVTFLLTLCLLVFGRIGRTISILFCLMYFSYNIYIYIHSLSLS